jgi:hypothetical protein
LHRQSLHCPAPGRSHHRAGKRPQHSAASLRFREPLIVIDDATAYDPCRDPLVLVVTKKQLARDGSAAVFFDPQSAATAPMIRFAVDKPYRPWHEQRRFSREARGLPPYKQREK